MLRCPLKVDLEVFEHSFWLDALENAVLSLPLDLQRARVADASKAFTWFCVLDFDEHGVKNQLGLPRLCCVNQSMCLSPRPQSQALDSQILRASTCPFVNHIGYSYALNVW